jgi:predicted lactoylglutathione lyase
MDWLMSSLGREQVQQFYEAGLKAGGKDNGPPGERFYHKGYYGAFLISPAGHNIEAVVREGGSA